MHCILNLLSFHSCKVFNGFNQTKFCKCKRWPVKIHVISGRVHRWEMLSQRISSGCSKERYNNGLWCCCSRKFCIYAISHGRHSCAKRRNFLQEAHSRRSKVTYYCGIFLPFFWFDLKVSSSVQVILFEINSTIFYTNLHELFCQFISWTNWANSGKFMDNCWISRQVMADMEITRSHNY